MKRQPKRIQRKRTKGWRMPEGAVYVGRGSFWDNPFRGPEALRLYRLLWRRRWKDLEREGIYEWLIPYLKSRLVRWERRLPELRGLDLACWCPLGADCHADVLLRKANAEKQA